MSNFHISCILFFQSMLSGCFLITDDLEKCREVSEYQQSRPAPRIETPSDLEELSYERRLPIPYGESNFDPAPADKPCLIEPPDYFDRDAA